MTSCFIEVAPDRHVVREVTDEPEYQNYELALRLASQE